MRQGIRNRQLRLCCPVQSPRPTSRSLSARWTLREHAGARSTRFGAALLGSFPDEGDLHNLLHWLIEKLVESLDELSALQTVDAEELRDALTKWVQGTSEADIEEAHPDAWEALTPRQLETMIPWALTAAFEVIAALAGDLRLRELGHSRLSPVRIRDGVPDSELCDLVREGADRVRVARMAAECREEVAGLPFVWDLKDAVKRRMAEEDEAEGRREADDHATSGEGVFFGIRSDVARSDVHRPQTGRTLGPSASGCARHGTLPGRVISHRISWSLCRTQPR